MNRTQYEYHPVIGYKFISNLKSRIQHEAGGYLVRTNSHGFRSDSEFEPAKSGARRVLVFGDSFTAGDGVSNKHRYTDLLQEGLEGTEVYNFGLPGSGTDQHYLLYREYAPLFEHDLLVIAVMVENIRRVNAHFRYFLDAEGETQVWQKPYFDLRDGTLTLKNTPVNPRPIPVSELDAESKGKIDTGGRLEGIRKIVKRLGMKEMAQKLVRFQPLPEYSRSSNPEWLLMKAILTRWIGESKVPVLLVPLPLFHHVEETASAKSYQARFAELGSVCRLHDPLPDLLRYDSATRRGFRFQRDVHPTREGHQALAASLLPIVRDMLRGS
jgi:lysophospholipase L1-like esterase